MSFFSEEENITAIHKLSTYSYFWKKLLMY